jgi:hypothetical protein
MVITYHGENYFKVQAGELTVLIDPLNQRSFKGACLILNTSKPSKVDFEVKSLEDSKILWIDHQGEYEIKGISVRGWSLGNDKGVEKTVYRFFMDELSVVVFGKAVSQLSENLKEHLLGADIVLGSELKAETWVKQLEPAIIVSALKNEKAAEQLDKLVIKKKDIVYGKAKLICLNS